MVGSTMNLISETYHSCKRREYTFMVLRKYIIIFQFSLIEMYCDLFYSLISLIFYFK